MLRHVPCSDEQGPTIYGATETGPDLQLHWTLVGALVVWGWRPYAERGCEVKALHLLLLFQFSL